MWADLPERNPDDARSERDPAAQDSGVRVRASRLEPVPEAGERVEALDFLRGAMAWAVAVYHLGILARAFAGGTPESSSVAALGLHAAPSFFLISGFCFFHLYGARRWGWLELRRFHVQRFLRIAPLFYFAIALHLVFDYQAGPSFSWARLLENVTFTFGLIHPNHAMVVGGWSIGLEYVFYLAFPVLAILLRSLAALSLGAAVLLALAWWHGLHVVQPAPDAARFNAYVLWPNHAYAFLLGGIAAKLRARTARRVPAGAALGVLALVLAVWSQLQPIVIDHFDLVLGITRAWYMLASFAIVTVFALTRTHSTRLRSVFAAFGDLSYPVYLLHPFAWLIVSWLMPGMPPLAALASALLLTLLLAAATHRIVERPVLRWRARNGQPLRAAAAGPGSPAECARAGSGAS